MAGDELSGWKSHIASHVWVFVYFSIVEFCEEKLPNQSKADKYKKNTSEIGKDKVYNLFVIKNQPVQFEM